MIGKMLATCMIQGGKPPVCFSNAVAEYLAYERIESHPCIDDIPDVSIRNLMNEVMLLCTLTFYTIKVYIIRLTKSPLLKK